MLKINKILLALLVSITFIIVSYNVEVSAAYTGEEEILKVNGNTVQYLYKSQYVTIPKEYVADYSEMRGAWVSTVWNGDMPRQTSTSETGINNYKNEFLKVLDKLEQYNMNTIFFQIRPCNDAFYESEINDWSKFLVNSGVNPGWDPLPWMIEETHKRGMQFQCWMNAFRVTETSVLDSDKLASSYANADLIQAKKFAISQLASKNFAKLHPEYVLLGELDTKLILNPGEPAVQKHIVDTIEEIITKYDVDGLHFDDYFYLNSKTNGNSQLTNLNFAGGTVFDSSLTGENTLNDLDTYRRYQANNTAFNLPKGLNLGDFRRQSLNNMMASIRVLIDNYNENNNKHVEFGSKPAAVWQSDAENCPDTDSTTGVVGGSNTHCGAYASNYNLFADTKAWVENGYVDWIAPQVYYDMANRIVPYADIVSWWADVVEKANVNRALENKKPIKMYVAHGIYKYAESSTEYNDESEIIYQLKFNQKFDVIKGSAVYAYNDLYEYGNTIHRNGMALFFNLWSKNKSLPLAIGTDDSEGLVISNEKIIEKNDGNTMLVRFKKLENTSMYAVYKVTKNETLDIYNTKSRINIVKQHTIDSEYMDITINNYNSDYDYYIQAVSNNYHANLEAYKLDFTNLTTNTAPAPIEVSLNNGNDKAYFYDKLEISFPYAIDAENDKLTYNVMLSLNGREGNFNMYPSELVYGSDKITCTWDAIPTVAEGLIARVIVSDNEFNIENYSNIVSINKKTVTPDPDPDPEPEKPENKSSCPLGVYYLATFTILVAFPLIVKRRNN